MHEEVTYSKPMRNSTKRENKTGEKQNPQRGLLPLKDSLHVAGLTHSNDRPALRMFDGECLAFNPNRFDWAYGRPWRNGRAEKLVAWCAFPPVKRPSEIGGCSQLWESVMLVDRSRSNLAFLMLHQGLQTQHELYLQILIFVCGMMSTSDAGGA